MKKHVFAVRFSLFLLFFVLFFPRHGSAQTFTVEEARAKLNAAARELTTPGKPLPRPRCVNAARLLDRADVTIDQVFRDRTLKGCISRPLDDLERLAERLADLGRTLQRECGIRRTYGATVTKLRSWENTPPCGVQDKQRRCKQYADTAVRQNRLNVKKDCGFTGPGWSDDHKGHYNWCLKVSENAAHQETQSRKIALDNCAVPGTCNRFIGTWKWFNGITVRISGDYRFSASGNSGTWRCLPNGDIEMHWKKGGWVDALSISPDGNSLSGRNQHGAIVSANRRQGMKQGMLYDVQQGPYGGGRLCLTPEEAKRLRNDPHTVKMTPVGKSCVK